MDTRPIGVFDSGIGGVTVLKEIRKLLPKENIVYYADTARVPYGPRPAGEIQEFSLGAVNFLLKKDIKLLVIACNTVTAVAFDYIVENVNIPVIGVDVYKRQDADRLIAADEKGNIVDGDHVLAICGTYLKEKGRLKNNTIVGTVMTNLGLDICLRENKIDIVKTNVGDRYVLEEMLKKGHCLSLIHIYIE